MISQTIIRIFRMKYNISNIQQTINNTILLFFFILFLITAFLIWNGIKQYYDFVSYQKTISFNSVTNAAGEINRYLRDTNRLVALFVNDNLEAIKEFSDKPDIESKIYQHLDKNVARYFPNHFAFTITDNHGEAYITHFEGKIGELCVADLNSYLKNDILLTRIHPNNIAHHFDVITKWSAGNKSGLFFVSFLTENLGRLINLAQIPKHNIIVVNPKFEYLIELTKDGSRINLDRDNYRLSTSELKNKLAQVNIPNTLWLVIDLVDDELFSDYLFKIILNSSLMLIFVLIIGISIVYLLKITQKVLLNEEKYKNNFILTVNHELRTPLASVIGSLDLIRKGVTGQINDKSLDLIEVAISNSLQLKLLVDDLLDIQSIVYDIVKYYKKPCELKAFIKPCIASIQTHDNKIQCNFNQTIVEKEIFIFIDERRVSHAIRNLLKNAVRNAKDNSIEVFVEKISDSIRISVTDHGDGIPENFQGIIFDQLMTLEQQANNNYMDVGVGLNLVKKIIEAHNGSVSFITKQGQGSTFYIDIPEYIDLDADEKK